MQFKKKKKTWSHRTIHIFKNYFVTVFSVFNNKQYLNRPLFFLLIHIYSYTSFNFFTFPLPLYLHTILNFTITLPSFFSLFYILTIFLPFLFCINFISFFSFNPYFSHKKNCEYSLGGFLFFLITLIKVDGYFFNMF